MPNLLDIDGFYTTFTTRLYDGDNNPSVDHGLYWRHPTGSKIDVTVLPLDGIGAVHCDLDKSFFDEAQNSAIIRLYVSQTCFVVGFPEGLVDRPREHYVWPVWKTGNIASEPYNDFQNEPIVVIDATTRPGMSGAPVMVRERHLHRLVNRFLGIYTGRYLLKTANGNHKEDAALGRVFKPKVITEIFRAGPNLNPPT